jgi:hypothetical protein
MLHEYAYRTDIILMGQIVWRWFSYYVSCGVIPGNWMSWWISLTGNYADE